MFVSEMRCVFFEVEIFFRFFFFFSLLLLLLSLLLLLLSSTFLLLLIPLLLFFLFLLSLFGSMNGFQAKLYGPPRLPWANQALFHSGL